MVGFSKVCNLVFGKRKCIAGAPWHCIYAHIVYLLRGPRVLADGKGYTKIPIFVRLICVAVEALRK